MTSSQIISALIYALEYYAA